PTFFLHAPLPTAHYPLSLHDALPIFRSHYRENSARPLPPDAGHGSEREESLDPLPMYLREADNGLHDGKSSGKVSAMPPFWSPRSEEHTLNSSHVKISYAVFCLKKKK